MTTPKGTHAGWTLSKYEGIPGLAMPRPPYWIAQQGERVITGATRSEVVAIIDAPKLSADHVAAITAALTEGSTK